MKTATDIVVLALMLLATCYALNMFDLKYKIDKALKLDKYTYPFHSKIEGACFCICNKRNKPVFNFTLATLDSIILIKKEGYTVDTIYVMIKNKSLDPITISEDEIDTMDLYEKLKHFLKRESLFVDAMKILVEDTVMLWPEMESKNA